MALGRRCRTVDSEPAGVGPRPPPCGFAGRGARIVRRGAYRIAAPEIERAMTSRWISEVPSKIV